MYQKSIYFHNSAPRAPKAHNLGGVVTMQVGKIQHIKEGSSYLPLLQAYTRWYPVGLGSMGQGSFICQKWNYFQISALGPQKPNFGGVVTGLVKISISK